MIDFLCRWVVFLVIFHTVLSGDVISLDSTNFDTLTETGSWFIKFYAPWCGHCQKLEPIWASLAGQVSEEIKIAEVDCTKYSLLCGKLKITGYPMLKWFEKGEIREYRGAREVDAMLQWIKEGKPEQVGGIVRKPLIEKREVLELNSTNFEQVLEGIWMINFYAPWCSHSKKLESTWKELSNHAGDYNVGRVNIETEVDIALKYSVRSTPTIILFKNGHHFQFSGPRSVSFLDQFARSEGLGEQVFINRENYDDEDDTSSGSYTNVLDLTEKPFGKFTIGKNFFLLIYAPWCGHCQKLLPIWEDLANKLVGNDVTVAKIDGTKNRQIMEKLNIKGYPSILYLSPGKENYLYSGKKDLLTLENFVLNQLKDKSTKDEL